MCGIVGVWSRGASDLDALAATTRAMRDRLTHRGPDDAGLWTDPGAGLALGHRRLSILDLSPEGRQPMASRSGRWTIVFNGEVYNHLELRRELPGPWRGTSDTETMLAAIDAWGLDRALARFVGMFAFALWDRSERQLHLVRDRLGIKPLHWGRADGALVFGSELKALTAHPRFDDSIDPDATAAFFASSCVPAPLSIHRGARKVLPGTALVFRDPAAQPEERTYWDLARIYAEGAASPFRGVSDRETVDRVRASLTEAVRLRLLADVPVGAFLSGGVDSSLVVALAHQVSRPLRTFSIGSADAAYDESRFAATVAARLGSIHTAVTISDADARAIVPLLPEMYDEPFADSSQIPTFLVSRLARGDVTVALSGDGGDEIFGGYNRYVWAPRALAIATRVPWRLRTAAARAIRRLPQSSWDALHARAAPVVPDVRLPGDKAHKLARAIEETSLDGMYRALRAQWWPSPLRAVRGIVARPVPDGLEPATALMLRDALEYLPDDILTKVDRASMAVSLEVRVPLLDHRVVELAARLPPSLKIRRGRGKWILRELLAPTLPRELLDRPKSGFSVPVGAWLRGPLARWADDLLDPRALRAAGLDADLVGLRWLEHRRGERDWGGALWDVVTFRAWAERRSARPERATLLVEGAR
jgi:asparagine synthase (glutamine-hydrolysing)